MAEFSKLRSACYLAGFLCLCLFFPAATQRKTVSPPSGLPNLNLLVITVDTLRADRLGLYGYPKIRTPNIDRLGKNGVTFLQALCHVPLTLPSHCSLFTGTLPIFHGVRDNGYRISSTNVTLAEILRDRGYRTAAFVGAFPLDSRFGLDKGFDIYDDFYGSKNIVRDLSFIERKAEEVNLKATEWLSKNRDRQFFMWIHYFDPHAPYEPPPPFDREYAASLYDGEVAYTDSIIGGLLDKMAALELLDNTLIVLTSDHGEGLGEHNEKTHGIFVYDSTLRVPLIFHNPRILPNNKVIPGQVGLIDVMPTVLDLLGLPKSPDLQGKSLKPAIYREKPIESGDCYIESIAAMLDRNWAPLQGIRTEDWKYIEAPVPELYDLVRDLKEEKNLHEERPKAAADMRKRLQELLKKKSSVLSDHTIETLRDNKETMERLRSLGYITGRRVENQKPDPKAMIEVDNLFNDAIIASETGKLELAGQIYEDVLGRQPNFVIAYEYAAYNYYKMGKLDEAVRLLERTIHMNLETSSLQARLGLYYQETGRMKDSIRILEKTLQRDENYVEAHNYLGVSFFKDGQLMRAIDSFQKAIHLDKNYAMAMNNLGNCYFALEKFDEAAAEYKKALSVDPKLASAHNGLGVVLYRQGYLAEAVESWERSVGIEPHQADALYNLGRAQLRLGLKQKALQSFEQFVEAASPQEYGKDIEEVRQVIERLKKEIRQDLGE